MRLTEEQRLLAARRRAQFAQDAQNRSRRTPPNGTARRGFRRRRWPSSAGSALWACWCREEYGGAGADHVGYALAIEEIAAGDGATSTIVSVHNSVGCMPVLQYGSRGAEAALSGAAGARRDARRASA